MDTIGMLVAQALLYGGKALADGLLGGAAKTAYSTLEARVKALFVEESSDVEAVDADVTDIEARISELSGQRQAEIMELAQEVVAALEESGTLNPAAVEIETLRAGTVRLGNIDATETTALRVRNVETDGVFSIDNLTARGAPGKI